VYPETENLDMARSIIEFTQNSDQSPLEAQISAQRLRCGRFILATNILDAAKLTADDALAEYKGQQGTERGFAFSKTLYSSLPVFFLNLANALRG
jgi:transposase